MDKGIVFLKDKKFDVLLAISENEQRQGLMYLDPPVPNMAFVYGQPRINKFWMNQTKAPLDIVFCCKNKIVSICKGEPYSTKLIGADVPTDTVVELPAGTCSAFGIGVGDKIKLECSNSSLMKIFSASNGFYL